LNPHYEAGMTGSTTLNAADFLKRAAVNQQISRGGLDFAERVMVLTPDELKTLLTEVKVPWPSTHALTMMAAWRQAMIQERKTPTGIIPPRMTPEEAEVEMFNIQEKWFENNQKINEEIRHFYDNNPQALVRNRLKVPNVTDLGYDPRIFGIDQGIASLGAEIRRTGIGVTTDRILHEAGLENN